MKPAKLIQPMTLLSAIIITCLVIAGTGTSVYGSELILPRLSVDANAKGLKVESIDGAFVSRSAILPGDKIKRSYSIKNHVGDDYSLSIHSQHPVSSPPALEKIMQVTITYDNAIVYDGDLEGMKDTGGTSLSEGIELGRIYPGDKRIFTAEFYFPGKELRNEYIDSYAAVDWILVAKKEKNAVSPHHAKPEDTSQSGGKTGDIFMILGTILVALVAIIIIINLFRKKIINK